MKIPIPVVCLLGASCLPKVTADAQAQPGPPHADVGQDGRIVRDVVRRVSTEQIQQVRRVLQEHGQVLGRRRGVSAGRLFSSIERLLDADTPEARQAVGTLIDFLCALQTEKPTWKGGMMAWGPGSEYRDQNVNLFLLPSAINLLRKKGRMPLEQADLYEEMVRRAVGFAERRWDNELFVVHRDFTAYSNAFALYVQALFLAGKHFQDERLMLKAEAQWRRWFNRVSYYGVEEFCSPNYNWTCYEALQGILRSCRDDRSRAEVRLALEHLYYLQHAIHHPVLGIPVCGVSRSYRRYLRPGRGRSEVLDAGAVEGYQPPEAGRTEFANRKYPYQMRGRATATPFRFQSYQEADAAVGSSTGGLYFPQNINCIVAVGRSPTQREILTIPGRHTFNPGYTHQEKTRVLGVFHRMPDVFLRTQEISPDSRMDDELNVKWPYTINISAGWEVTVDETSITLTGYGRVVSLFPFVLEDGRIRATKLERRAMDVYSNREAICFLWPDTPRWAGYALALCKRDEAVPVPSFAYKRIGREIRFTCDWGLSLRLFQLPCGEVTELYGNDWRVSPLLECPTQTLWPGQLTGQIADLGLQGPPLVTPDPSASQP